MNTHMHFQWKLTNKNYYLKTKPKLEMNKKNEFHAKYLVKENKKK